MVSGDISVVNLFQRIGGRSPEDLTTEVLAFLLSDDRYAPYQGQFYQLIDGELRSSKERQMKIRTQPWVEKTARPDMVLAGCNETIVLENKFYAWFTSDEDGNPDQIRRYFDYLVRKSDKQRKYLVLLTLEERRPAYVDAIVGQFADDPSVRDEDTLLSRLKADGVRFRVILWEDVLASFNNCDVLVEQLSSYIRDTYGQYPMLSKEELKMLHNVKVSKLMRELSRALDIAVSRISSQEGYSGKQWSSGMPDGHLNYGYYVEVEGIGRLWVGYANEAWERSGENGEVATPFFLQISPQENENIHWDCFEKELKNLGFIWMGRWLDWVYPIRVSERDLPKSIYEGTTSVTRRMRERLDTLQ